MRRKLLIVVFHLQCRFLSIKFDPWRTAQCQLTANCYLCACVGLGQAAKTRPPYILTGTAICS